MLKAVAERLEARLVVHAVAVLGHRRVQHDELRVGRAQHELQRERLADRDVARLGAPGQRDVAGRKHVAVLRRRRTG